MGERTWYEKALLALGVLILAAVPYFYLQNRAVQIERISLAVPELPRAFEGFRILQISDLHLPKSFLPIADLRQTVGREKPDIIVMTGDIVDCASRDPAAAGLEELCRALTAICPVFAVSGNHEVRGGFFAEYVRVLRREGVVFLDQDFYVLEKDGALLAVLGLRDGYLFSPSYYPALERFDGDPKILLAHRPELYESYGRSACGVAAVFSGHAHGGQLRIPGVGGLFAPNQDFFPKYTSGVYPIGNGVRLVVSRGLGNSVLPLRVNNRVHLPVVTLTAAGELGS